MHEHPSQGLLDAYTILRHKKSLKGLKVTMIGDIQHSRVVRSNVHLLSKFGAQIVLCGPPELLPEYASSLAPGVKISRHLEEAARKGRRDHDAACTKRTAGRPKSSTRKNTSHTITHR